MKRFASSPKRPRPSHGILPHSLLLLPHYGSLNMKIFCCGSANLDFVYRMPHFVRPGETIAATERSVYCGGKGLNQAIALARAGLSVSFVGRIGADGSQLLRCLNAEAIDTSLERAAKAASLCVSRAGASDSIPRLLELQ